MEDNVTTLYLNEKTSLRKRLKANCEVLSCIAASAIR